MLTRGVSSSNLGTNPSVDPELDAISFRGRSLLGPSLFCICFDNFCGREKKILQLVHRVLIMKAVYMLVVAGLASTSAFTATPALTLRSNALPLANQNSRRHGLMALSMQEGEV